MQATSFSRRALIVGIGAAGVSAATFAASEPRTTADIARAAIARYRATGPFPVSVANPISMAVPEQSKNLLVRVTYPDPSAPSDGTPFPVVLFSHETGASKDLYGRIAEHWASHGYVTIQPTHLDSNSFGYKPGSLQPSRLASSRVADLKSLLDRLGELAQETPALVGRVMADKVAVAGHGDGVLAALTLSSTDTRIKAVVSLNGVGPTALAANEWNTVKVPVFASAGTIDPGTTPEGKLTSWRWRLAAFERTAGTPRYGLSIAGGDHDFGGLIARDEPPRMPDTEGLAVVNVLSTAFLEATFASGDAARTLLDGGDVAALTHDRAFLERVVKR